LLTAQTKPRAAGGPVFAALRRLEILGPLAVVAVLFGVVIGNRLTTYHGNATGFILIGSKFRYDVHAPRGARVGSPFGYDGQFFYLQAADPLVLHDRTLQGFERAGQVFRLQRMAYPTLAYLAAAGQRGALPWGMLAVNIAVVLLATLGFALYARRRGWSGWWALCAGLLAGFLTGTVRDLSDPLGVASVLGGLIAWQSERRWTAAALLSVAALAREPMMLAVAGIAAESGYSWWRARRLTLADLWPVVVVPVGAFVLWQLYIDARYGGNSASSSGAFLPPFQGVVDEVRHALDDPFRRDGVWDLAFLALMMLGLLASIRLVWRERTAPAFAALLFGLSLLVLKFGDPWSYSRLSAPMFAALVVAGLQRRDRPALAISVAGAALTLVMPFTPWFGAV
jgi:hypothetical protein